MEELWSTDIVREKHSPEVDVSYDMYGNLLAKTSAWSIYLWGYHLPDRFIVKQEDHIEGRIDKYLRCRWKDPDGWWEDNTPDTFDCSLTDQVWRPEFREKYRDN